MSPSARRPWTDYWLSIASQVATRSTCPRLQVGAVLVLENRVLATGYNGAPSGEAHCLDLGCDLISCSVHDSHCIRAVHAEGNILAQLRWLESLTVPLHQGVLDRTTLYLSHEPCPLCRSRLEAAAITHFVWSQPYREHYAEGDCSLLA